MAFRNRIVRISQLIVDVLRTAAAPGTRWEITSAQANTIVGYTGDSTETQAGQLQVGLATFGAVKRLFTLIAGPRMTGGSPNGAAIISLSDQNDRAVSSIVLVADEIRSQAPGASSSELMLSPGANKPAGGAVPNTGSALGLAGPWSSTAPPNGTTGVPFTITQDGSYLLTFCGSAYNTLGATIAALNYYIDGTQVAQGRHFFNPASTHMTFTPTARVVALAPGTHYLYIAVGFAGTASDSNDYAQMTFVRIGP